MVNPYGTKRNFSFFQERYLTHYQIEEKTNWNNSNQRHNDRLIHVYIMMMILKVEKLVKKREGKQRARGFECIV